MKKVLILIKNIDGGTGTFLNQIITLKGFDIKVAAIEKPKYSSKDLDAHFFSKKPLYVSRYKVGKALFIDLFKEFLWFRRIVMDESPDVVLSIDTHCNLLSMIYSLFDNRYKTILTNHNNLTAVVKRKLSSLLIIILKMIGSVLFREADKIVCVSKGVADDYKAFFSLRKEINIIPYGLDLNRVNRLKKAPLSASRQSIFNKKVANVISIGRFENQKDFKTLIKSFSDISHAQLILVGDGSQRNQLEKLVKKLKIVKKVIFLGWEKNIYSLLTKADLFVLSSNYEGFGYVLLEAMACGVPIISTNSSYGPAEVLDNGKYGILVPVGDSGAMSKAISSILVNKREYRLYKNRIKRRIGEYDEEKMKQSYKALIERAIS